jgi:hypothetical protein
VALCGGGPVQFFDKSDLLSLIMIREKEKLPSTFQELAGAPDFRLTLDYRPGFPCDANFKHSTDPLYVRLRPRIERLNDTKTCVKMVFQERRRVCIGWSSILENFLTPMLATSEGQGRGRGQGRGQGPSVSFSKDVMVSSTVSASVPMNSKFEGALGEVVGWVRDTGHIDRWKDEVKSYMRSLAVKKGREGQSSSSLSSTSTSTVTPSGHGDGSAVPFNMNHVITHFSLWAVGLVSSMIVFLSEVPSGGRGRGLCPGQGQVMELKM